MRPPNLLNCYLKIVRINATRNREAITMNKPHFPSSLPNLYAIQMRLIRARTYIIVPFFRDKGNQRRRLSTLYNRLE